MDKYEVIHFFTDLEDSNHAYNVGDEYPRDGITPKKDRIKTLMSRDNLQGKPLIKAIFSKHEPDDSED